MSSSWNPLQSRRITAVKNRTDPYLQIADGTDFVDYGRIGQIEDPTFPVLVEVQDGTNRPALSGFTILGSHPGSRYFTASIAASAFGALVSDSRVERAQFAATLVPQRPGRSFQLNGQRQPPAALPNREADAATSKVLLGVIDSGCPFAHLDLRRGTKGTRVVRLWDQGSGAFFGGLGKPPSKFGYGCELRRSELEALIEQSTSSAPAVDEAACYHLAGYEPAMHRVSHGAHSLGMFAAARRWNARPSSTNPVKVAQGVELSREADIVFVQFPRDVMDCVSVAALENHALDGFRYILDLGKTLEYERVVVSFGYESWIGPHDGSSWFAEAVRSLLGEARKALGFDIYTIAGNAKDRRVRVAAEPGETQLNFGLSVQPGSEAPTFVEIWAPNELADLTFELTPPHEEPLSPITWGAATVWPDVQHPLACVVMDRSQVLGKGDCAIVLRIAPTHVTDNRHSAAPHGMWRIQLSANGKPLDRVRAYVGRSEETLGAGARARQSTFTGRDRRQSELDRKGTVNGHAPGSGMGVSGAYFGERFPYARTINKFREIQKLHDEATPYSGSGPLPNGDRALSDSITTEDGIYNPGVLGMGNYSGVLFRMSGTSVAAPLRARMHVDASLPKKTEEEVVERPDMGRLLDPF